MIRRYLRPTVRRPPRPAAALKLIEAYEAAVKRIEAGPQTWLTHPRPYPEIARFGFRWIKVHRYWFGYVAAADPIITNILDEAGDITARVSADRTPADLA
jgi:hypothetical protein